MPDFEKHPTEFYGKKVSRKTARDFETIFRRQRCPYLDRWCVKQRKSDPSQTIGSCSVGYQGKPLIICPHRFLQGQQIFLDCTRLLESNKRYKVVPEVRMSGGSVDYFVIAQDDSDAIVDYAGIEIQALDTTGSGGIWDARVDLSGGQLSLPYSYGINWKMSAKTILLQLHHKATDFEALGKKLVLISQSEFSEYIVRTFQADRLRDSSNSDSVHFFAYDLIQLGEGFQLRLANQRSTNVIGVERMLGS